MRHFRPPQPSSHAALAALVLCLLGSGAQAQTASLEDGTGSQCVEAWITLSLQQINGSDLGDLNDTKPYRLSQYGHFTGADSLDSVTPEDWATTGGTRNSYMWHSLYAFEDPFPSWPGEPMSIAGPPGMRYFVTQCLAQAGEALPDPLPIGPGNGGTAALSSAAAVPVISPAGACPGSWSGLSTLPDVVLGCTCGPANTAASVWGSGPYTSDSNLCAAAVHAGVIDADGGVVWSTIGGPGDSFAGSDNNGVSSLDYGAYGSTARFIAISGAAEAATQPEACPADARGAGDRLTCYCAPSALSGSVWGTGVYTDDSQICAAALHAGAVSPAGGAVTFSQQGGQESFAGSTSNGITSSDYGKWGGSFGFE